MLQTQKRRVAGSAQQQKELQIVNIQRNPYLAEYDKLRRNRTSQKNAKTVAINSRVVIADYTRQPQRGLADTRAGDDRESVRTGRGIARKRRAAARRRRMIRRRRVMKLAGLICLAITCFSLYRIITDKPQVDGSVPPTGSGTADLGELFSAQAMQGTDIQGLDRADYLRHPIWTEDFLTVNDYSRPGEELKEVKNIFVHYTANPGTSAAQNRSYFEQLKDTHERSASAHFIIGYEGEIVQCIPLNEIAYAVQGRNEDSISIECCYTAEDGSFTQQTYDTLIKLLQWLTDVYDLQEEDILRHYDCGGKKCPLYYTEHEDAWEQLKRDVGNL